MKSCRYMAPFIFSILFVRREGQSESVAGWSVFIMKAE